MAQEHEGAFLVLDTAVTVLDFPVDERFGPLSGKQGVGVYFDPDRDEYGIIKNRQNNIARICKRVG